MRFDTMVIGSGMVGNMIAEKTVAIGGSGPPLNAMSGFRDRMIGTMDASAPKVSPRDLSKDPLDVIIIQNKRFDGTGEESIKRLVRILRDSHEVHAEYVNWGSFRGKNKAAQQMRRVQNADVYVSSIGTALQYVPFMRDGCVFIALGAQWTRAGRTVPAFMEQQLSGGGTPYLRTLYADPGEQLRKNPKLAGEDMPWVPGERMTSPIKEKLLLKLILQAKELVSTGFKIPVDVKENISPEGRVLIEYCEEDPQACDRMMENRNWRTYECMLVLWPENVVYEIGPWSPKGYHNNHCSLNRKLLHRLRHKYGLPGYGANESF